MKEIIVSVITVTRNPGPEILDTIKGIGDFISDEVEYILVDGNSKPEILNTITSNLPAGSKFLTEPDLGIYDAMNKAWIMASGKFLLFINEGDQLLHLPLNTLRVSEADVLLGSVFLDGDCLFQGKNSKLLRFRNLWPHQGTFYKRTVPFRYNPSLKIFGDFDLNQHLFCLHLKIEQMRNAEPIARHQRGGISGSRQGLDEFYRIIRTNFGLWAVIIAFLWFKLDGLKKKLYLYL